MITISVAYLFPLVAALVMFPMLAFCGGMVYGYARRAKEELETGEER